MVFVGTSSQIIYFIRNLGKERRTKKKDQNLVNNGNSEVQNDSKGDDMSLLGGHLVIKDNYTLEKGNHNQQSI